MNNDTLHDFMKKHGFLRVEFKMAGQNRIHLYALSFMM